MESVGVFFIFSSNFTIKGCVPVFFLFFPLTQDLDCKSCMFPIDILSTALAKLHIGWCLEVVQKLLSSVFWSKWWLLYTIVANFADVSACHLDMLVLFRRRRGSGCALTYRWSHALANPSGMFCPDKHSSVSHKQNFSQITVNFMIFCV